MKKFLFIIPIIILLISLYFILNSRVDESSATPLDEKSVQVDRSEITIEEVATGLSVPWDILFTSENRMLVTERKGTLRVIENGVLKQEPLHQFKVSSDGEEGLMSLALDPEYEKNRFIYISLAYDRNGEMFVKVLRFKDEGESMTEEAVIIDNIPAAKYHAGSRIAFGPDGMLYITTGDATDKKLAQDLSSLAGKILRINKDGSIPGDNPFKGSAVWSYGHRNSQGIAWDEAGQLYETEHGPSLFDGPAGGDEVNRIVKGGNYGWPLVSHEKTREGTIAALKVYTPAVAPASLAIIKGNLYFGGLKGEGLFKVTLSEDGTNVLTSEKISEVEYGRIREVIEGPDGNIYFSTSNKDGRGSPEKADDRIFRLIQK